MDLVANNTRKEVIAIWNIPIFKLFLVFVESIEEGGCPKYNSDVRFRFELTTQCVGDGRCMASDVQVSVTDEDDDEEEELLSPFLEDEGFDNTMTIRESLLRTIQRDKRSEYSGHDHVVPSSTEGHLR